MIVWVVEKASYDHQSPVGVYSSHERAVEAAKADSPHILKWKIDEDGMTEDRIVRQPIIYSSDMLEHYDFTKYEVDQIKSGSIGRT